MRKILFALLLVLGSGGVHGAPPQALTQARLGEELFRAGKWNDAQRELLGARAALDSGDAALAERIDARLALCAARTGAEGARAQLERFVRRYARSVWENEVRFALAGCFYADGDMDRAAEAYGVVAPERLERDERQEYYFKAGHALFVQGDREAARDYLARVEPRSEFAPHAAYYLAYMDYEAGRYDSARRRFASLADHPAYAAVAPFYLLQIEFLEGNYAYVTEHADALIASATQARRTDIERAAAESWFRLGDYARALAYMERYVGDGGVMGREENYLAGFSRYRSADYAGAAPVLALVCGPDDALTQNAAYHLADCFLKEGDKARAMQSFAMASSADFDAEIAEDALFNYGKLQYELGGGRFGEAINVLTRYLKRYPSSPRAAQARECLVAAYYNSRNYDAAYQAIRQLPDPDNNLRAALQKITYFRGLEYYNSGDADDALRLLAESQATRSNPKYTALAGFWQGEILYRRGDYAAAKGMFTHYLRLAPPTEPEYPMALYNLGYCSFYTGDLAGARSRFEAFLARHSARDAYRADALNRVGDILYAGRDYAGAIGSYDKAAALGGEARHYALYQRAVMLGLTDRVPAKIEALRSIIARGEGPYVDRANYELGRTYILSERYADGAEVLQRFVAEYPASEFRVAALCDLGLVYQNLGESDRALEYYKQVIAIAPKAPQAKDALAGIRGIYVDENDVGSYFAFAKRAGIETDLGVLQRDSITYLSAQKVYTSGDAARAGRALEEYVSQFPNGTFLPEAYYYLSDCRSRLGDGAGSLAALRMLEQLPDNAYTVRGLERLSRQAFAAEEWAQAAAAYRRLIPLAATRSGAEDAALGYVRATVRHGDASRIAAMADEVVAMEGAGEAARREALAAKAALLREAGDTASAMVLYRELSTEVQSREGAEAALRLIEAAYAAGRTDEAEQMVFDLSEKNPPHPYWVARAFLVLGDIYRDKGDAFQARATYQSIVDGYGDESDGIVGQARERIEGLK